MNSSSIVLITLFVSLLSFVAENRQLHDQSKGKRWAVLVAGSNGFMNYRHQADVCHAYQILKKGGLKDENIIVFMYDDIASNEYNPRPGVIINKPYGDDVYYGVPKDYTGENVTTNNVLAVILGNKTALTGGSGKVVNSGPNDYIFIYYTDHGGPGIVGMPSEYLYGKDLVHALKKKHEATPYKSMVFYLEACESGSMFDGLLPENLNIYAVTASSPNESSYAAYCNGYYCLGDLFSISWLEDSEKHNLQNESLKQQYGVVKRRTGYDSALSSHVMQYGTLGLTKNLLSTYIGTNPENENYTFTDEDDNQYPLSPETIRLVSQRDAILVYLEQKFNKAPEGSQEKIEAEKRLHSEISDRQRVDSNIKSITALLFGNENGRQMVEYVRPAGKPLVDDWDCLKMLVSTYEQHCGILSMYGRKYTRAMANMCNAGMSLEKMIMATTQICS